MARKKTGTVVPVGKRVKKARLQQKMTLSDVANQTGMSTDYLKKLEAGKEIPPVGTLLQIARALAIDSMLLLKEDEDGAVDKRKEAYAKRTANYAYETLTPGAEKKHLKAFRVTVDPMQDHSGVGYQHEGEEFAYVLAGKIEITVGDHVNVLGQGESLHFNSAIKHHMRNIGDAPVQMLVVIYGP